MKLDYPDSNLADSKSNYEYYIEICCLDYDKNDEEGFKTLCSMMNAYHSYDNRNKWQ